MGLPGRLLLTPGQASDKTTLPSLIDGLRPAREAIADRGYSARSIIDLFAALGTTAHIPSQSNVRVVRTVDLQRYRQRNLIERFFNKLNICAASPRATTSSPRFSSPAFSSLAPPSFSTEHRP